MLEVDSIEKKKEGDGELGGRLVGKRKKGNNVGGSSWLGKKKKGLGVEWRERKKMGMLLAASSDFICAERRRQRSWHVYGGVDGRAVSAMRNGQVAAGGVAEMAASH